MKKIFGLVMVAALLMTVFAGCKNKQTVGQSVSSADGGQYLMFYDEDGNFLSATSGTTSDILVSSSISSTTSATSSSAYGEPTVVTVYKTGWPIVDKKVTFDIMGRTSPNAAAPGNMDMFKYLEENTNININFIPVAESEIRERKIVALASGDVPDAFAFGSSFLDYEIDKYAHDGVIVDVGKYLKDYAPNIYSEFENYPIQNALNCTAEGKIYTLPAKTIKSDYINYDHYLCINRKWLDNLGLDIPETIPEFLDTMRAFRDCDPNGNGQPDEIPFAQWNWSAGMILQSWGLHNGTGNIGVDLNYKAYYPLTTPNAKTACEYWYNFVNETGLMDTSIPGKNSSGSWVEFSSHIRTGKVGCFQWSYLTSERFPSDLLKDFIAIPIPTANFKNAELSLPKAVNPYSSVQTRGNIIFTKACQNIPALLRYFDYFYTDEGIMVGNYGDPSNGLYEKLSDGNYQLTEEGSVANAGLKHAPGWTMGLPGTTALINCKIEETESEDDAVYNAFAKHAKATYKKANQENPTLRMSNFMLTSDEIIKLRKFSGEFASSAAAGKMSYYVTSKTNALQNWVTDVNALEAKGLSEYVAIYQKVVDRNKAYIKPLY